MRSRYTWTDDGRVVRIVDLNLGDRSVTNDAENVIRDIVGFGIPVDERQIIYRDSEGAWSVLATRGGQFRGFIPLAYDGRATRD